MKKLCLLTVLPALALAVASNPTVQLNRWTSNFSNSGMWGYTGSAAGGFWQGGQYVFGAGLWVGSVLPGGDTLVTMGYNPNSGGSEMFPTLVQYWREGSGNADDRVYVYPSDWPPTPSRFPMAPTTAQSDVEVWSGCCDSNPANHVAPGRPLGIDLYTTVFADTTAGLADFFLMRYAIANPTDAPLDKLCVGIICDPDVGSNATNDLCGAILDKQFVHGADTFRVRNTAFAWSQDHSPSGAVAVRYLSGPLGDTITALKIFTLDNDPVTDGAEYMTLAGYDWQTSQYAPFDTVDPTPGDKRFLLAAGSFTVAPHETTVCWFAVIGAQFSTSDTSELAYTAHLAYEHWQSLLGIAEAPGTPSAAALRVFPSVLRAGATLSIEAGLARVYDTRGVLVRELAGSAPLRWDGCDARGRLVPGGVYFITERQQAGAKVLFVRD